MRVFVTACVSFVTGHHWEVSVSIFFLSFYQVLILCNKILPEPSLLQAEQSQAFQPPLLFQILQALDHLHDPLLDLLQNIHVPLVLGAQIWAQHSRCALTSLGQRNKDLCWHHRSGTAFPQGHIAGAWSTCLPQPQCFPWQNCFPVILVLVHGVILQLQGLAFSFTELHESPLCPVL